MNIERMESKGLSHYSYVLEDKGEAAVIDPSRDVWRYIEKAEEMGARIRYIIETHRHEDFVSGGVELWEKTGAPVLHGKALDFGYGENVKDGDTFPLGSMILRILETPGHTDESITVVVKESLDSHADLLAFTGDLIFFGDVGRVDLYGEEMKRDNSIKMFGSIEDKIKPLGDHLIILPAHGKGSVCGGAIKSRDLSTLGYELKNSPLLDTDEKEFLEIKENESMEVPPYFSRMEVLNLNGPPLLTEPGRMRPMDIEQFLELHDQGAQILDVRDPLAFSSGHVPGSLNIWLKGLPAFGGWFLDYEKPIIIIDNDCTRIDEAWRDLIRLGYDNIKGYLSQGFSGYTNLGKEVAMASMVDIEGFKGITSGSEDFILDVRDSDSWERDGHIKGAERIYVGYLPARLDEVPRDRKVIIYCDSGYKTGIAASLLLLNGFHDVQLLHGGMNAWRKAGLPVENG
jgi:hydroxyacylglutathione hydrolase